ncbi:MULTISPECIES: SEC-C metal-binding domain-containing protein [Pseudomonadaceae]|uniref:Nucleic acid-binding protein n=1 Tax=Metapseudomonas otitidis TaxID=319939 RepID=A0A7X3KW37_9GAMM|nr:nucleic acid-binding protein [Pseudomonas otitidis]QZX84055.1 SEC-C domain-containing protein [Pseudomonas otitidis]
MRKGYRTIGDKVLAEKLGRNDLCPCGSRRLFQALLPETGLLSMAPTVTTTSARRTRL